VFEGSRGTGTKSDIAVDDITVIEGACPLPGKPDRWAEEEGEGLLSSLFLSVLKLIASTANFV